MRRSVSAVLVTALILALLAPSASARADDYTAFLEGVFPAGPPPGGLVRIERHRQGVPVSPGKTLLKPGDKIILLRADALVTIRDLTSNTQTPVRHRKGRLGRDPDLTVPSAELGSLPEHAAAWFVAVVQGANQAREKVRFAGSRGPLDDQCRETAGPEPTVMPFEAPMLDGGPLWIAAARRSVFVAWRGGRAPFTVTLASQSGGEMFPPVRVDASCSVRLPPVDLQPGAYRLAVTDADGVSIASADSVEARADLPQAPPELSASSSATARRLQVATWLESLPERHWRFEAIQQVSELACASPAATAWLEPWGRPACAAPRVAATP